VTQNGVCRMTNPRRWIAILTVTLLACVSHTAKAQRMFLDSDGDGEATANDHLATDGTTLVSIWLESNSRASTTSLAARNVPDAELSIFSYEFILHADGGRVQWGKYTNNQPTMSVPLGPHVSETDFYIGQMGMVPLAAGRHKLGTLEVRVISGRPSLSFAASSPVWMAAETSFGSTYEGRDSDNTIKFFSPGNGRREATAPAGEWGDGVGLDADRAMASPPMSEAANTVKLEFGIRQLGGAQSGTLQLIVTTTRPGSLRLRLFSVSGRLVRVLADERNATPGVHEFSVGGASNGKQRLPAGVYYYRLQASEGIRSGKVVIIQ